MNICCFLGFLLGWIGNKEMHDLKPFNQETHSHNSKTFLQYTIFYMFQPTYNRNESKEAPLNLTKLQFPRDLFSLSAISSEELSVTADIGTLLADYITSYSRVTQPPPFLLNIFSLNLSSSFLHAESHFTSLDSLSALWSLLLDHALNFTVLIGLLL